MNYFTDEDDDVYMNEINDVSIGMDLTPDLLDAFIECILFQNKLGNSGCTVDVMKEIMMRTLCIFKEEEILLTIRSPVTVVGDIHGQLDDLLKLLSLGGMHIDYRNREFRLEKDVKFLFMGDYVDRGAFSVEVFMLLLSLKLKYPNQFYLLRGNHELRDINKVYGFSQECCATYSYGLWENFNEVFDTLPICAVIDQKIFCVHGGLSPKLRYLEEIANIDRTSFASNSGISDMLWSDPDDFVQTFFYSPRGAGYLWGEQATTKFLKENHLELIIRAHQLQQNGYLLQHDNKVLTIFSATNYCSRSGNDASIVKIRTDNIINIVQFSSYK